MGGPGLQSEASDPAQYCDTCHPDNMNDQSDEFDISEEYFEDNEFVCSSGFFGDELSWVRGSQNGKMIGSRFPSEVLNEKSMNGRKQTSY